ncbi:MAG: hypothetical protein KY432_06640 [Acidobacteria bacterium]|nr:hypothetical protein [Acidobacteriota bacterium]
MKILHLVHSDDPPFLLHAQGRDAALLRDGHTLETWMLRGNRIITASGDVPFRQLADAVTRAEAALCHFYTLNLPSPRILRSLPAPWIAPTSGSSGWLFLRRTTEPARTVSPHPAIEAPEVLPEIVDGDYFHSFGALRHPSTVGGVVTERTRQQYDAVRARIARLRDDVRWRPFDSVPIPREMATVACWVDFGVAEDEEGGVVESLVSGRAVIAPRTELNRQRLLEGEAGFLVPQNDPNETAHVILTALFKPEVARERIETAVANRDRFLPSKRLRELETLYHDVTRHPA